jgi:hypothetical protein
MGIVDVMLSSYIVVGSTVPKPSSDKNCLAHEIALAIAHNATYSDPVEDKVTNFLPLDTTLKLAVLMPKGREKP